MNDGERHQLGRAAEEYLWLLNHGYPQKTSLKMVGDKVMLPGALRQVLYRGIAPSGEARRRREKAGTLLPGDRVGVDAYNVLFTVNNYLLGKQVFLCNDGYLRDAGEMRGRILKKPVFDRSVGLLLDTLEEWPGISFHLFLDEPVSHSADLAVFLSREMEMRGISGQAQVDRSPDRKLIEIRSEVLCSSDTVVIDRHKGRVYDLPRHLLERQFSASFTGLLPEDPDQEGEGGSGK